jgi:hypothetical protein
MVQRAATHIARKAVELDIVPGRSPISVAAAAIYMASQVCIWHADIDVSDLVNWFFGIPNEKFSQVCCVVDILCMKQLYKAVKNVQMFQFL